MLEDPESNDNLIKHDFSAALKLPSTPLSLVLIVLGHQHESRQLQAYVLCLFNMNGRKQVIQAIGVNKLTELEQAPEHSALEQQYCLQNTLENTLGQSV